MMREFQAENDRHQTTIENNLTTLINATTDHVDLTVTSNDESILIPNKQQGLSDNDSNQSKINIITTSESRTNGDKNKLNIKPASRLTSDILAVRFCLIFKFLYPSYSRHQDVQHMIYMVVYQIFMYESNKVTE